MTSCRTCCTALRRKRDGRSENFSAARHPLGSPAGIRAPTPKCSAPRQLQKTKPHALQPRDRVFTRQSFRRKIEQPVRPCDCVALNLPLLAGRNRAVQKGRRNSHLRQLRHLVPCIRAISGDTYAHRAICQQRRRQLVTQKISSPPVGITTQASCPASKLRTIFSCRGRKES